MNPLYEKMDISIFEAMSLLAAEHGAVNLGQGFPDFGWRPEMLAAAASALSEQSSQYAPSRGLPALRAAIADHYRRHQGLAIEPAQVVVTSGATEALAAAILAAITPGDEALVLTPAYDAYAPLVRRAGGTVREVALEPPGWRLTREALERAIGPATRLLIFNHPHNPTGRCFDADELAALADVVRAHGLLVISDEVWEHLALGGGFRSLAAIEGIAGQVIKVGSAGKIFSLTGWKIGWLVAPPPLADLAARAHQFLTFSSAPALQHAVAWGLGRAGDGWFKPMREGFARARDRMVAGLADSGFAVLPAEATYFLVVDLAASGLAVDDREFAERAVREAGVAVIPLSSFAERPAAQHHVRLCFAKSDDTIDRGVAAMDRARRLMR